MKKKIERIKKKGNIYKEKKKIERIKEKETSTKDIYLRTKINIIGNKNKYQGTKTL
jgi:hypothetical protein